MQRDQTEERMAGNVKKRLIQYLLYRKEEEGFTLVELIVVVMIIGILSSIAIPSFMSLGDKAKQKEASVLLSSYVKAAQSFYIENSRHPSDAADLGQYMSVTGCKNAIPSNCKRDSPEVYTASRGKQDWVSPLGYFHIHMNRTPSGGSDNSDTQTIFNAMAAGQYADKGFGVSACFSSKTGLTKLSEEKGPTVFTQVRCE